MFFTHGTDAILAAVAHLAPEPHAQVTVSTAHKAKGREWPRVLIADDFARPKDNTPDEQTGPASAPDPIDDAEARLAYVAVTRTRQRLDLGGLSWIHDHPDGAPRLVRRRRTQASTGGIGADAQYGPGP